MVLLTGKIRDLQAAIGLLMNHMDDPFVLQGVKLLQKALQEAKKGSVFVCWIDGSCLNDYLHPHPGGWAVVFENGPSYSGSEPDTSNQRMELTAAIKALEATPPGSVVTVHSDSAYLVEAFRQCWFQTWQKNGWRNSRGQPVANQDLWMRLIALANERSVTFVKVDGHSGLPYNEQAHQLAFQCARLASSLVSTQNPS